MIKNTAYLNSFTFLIRTLPWLSLGVSLAFVLSCSSTVKRDDAQEQLYLTIEQNQTQFERCFDDSFKRTEDFETKLILDVTINQQGYVENTKVNTVNLKSKEIANCMSDIVGSLSFPRFEAGEPAKIRYPFTFVLVGLEKDEEAKDVIREALLFLGNLGFKDYKKCVEFQPATHPATYKDIQDKDTKAQDVILLFSGNDYYNLTQAFKREDKSPGTQAFKSKLKSKGFDENLLPITSCKVWNSIR